jgi:hypothetical protein
VGGETEGIGAGTDGPIGPIGAFIWPAPDIGGGVGDGADDGPLTPIADWTGGGFSGGGGRLVSDALAAASIALWAVAPKAAGSIGVCAETSGCGAALPAAMDNKFAGDCVATGEVADETAGAAIINSGTAPPAFTTSCSVVPEGNVCGNCAKTSMSPICNCVSPSADLPVTSASSTIPGRNSFGSSGSGEVGGDVSGN